MFIQVGDVQVRAESVWAVRPSASGGSTVYAGSTAFSTDQAPDVIIAALNAVSS